MDEGWYKTHSIFLRKGSIVCDYVINKIDKEPETSQSIRRLCRYMTKDPLSTKSVDSAGNKVLQSDLVDSLREHTKEGNINETKHIPTPCLINGSFDMNMKTIEQCYIFVHNHVNKYNGNDMGDTYIRIDIIIPDRYDNIIDPESEFEFKRGDALCFLIDDMLNEHIIEDEKYSKYIGNLKFEFCGNTKERLTKSTDGIIYSLTYKLASGKGRVANANLQRI